MLLGKGCKTSENALTPLGELVLLWRGGDPKGDHSFDIPYCSGDGLSYLGLAASYFTDCEVLCR